MSNYVDERIKSKIKKRKLLNQEVQKEDNEYDLLCAIQFVHKYAFEKLKIPFDITEMICRYSLCLTVRLTIFTKYSGYVLNMIDTQLGHQIILLPKQDKIEKQFKTHLKKYKECEYQIIQIKNISTSDFAYSYGGLPSFQKEIQARYGYNLFNFVFLFETKTRMVHYYMNKKDER